MMGFIMYIVPDTEFTASYVEHTMILHGAHGTLYGGSIQAQHGIHDILYSSHRTAFHIR